MTTVLLTRPAGSDDVLAAELTGHGLQVVSVPTIATEPAPPGGELDAAVADLDRFDWVVVTSPTGVRAVADAAHRVSSDLAGARPRWAVVGPATARALEAAGAAVSVAPDRARGSALATALVAVEPLAGRRVLVPRADIAAPDLPDALRAAGADVVEVVAYRTIEGPSGAVGPLAAALELEDLGAVVVASGSAIRGLLRLARAIDRAGAPAGAAVPGVADRRLRSLALVTIGPATSEAARAAGLDVAAEAHSPTTPSLVTAVLEAVRGTAPRPANPTRHSSASASPALQTPSAERSTASQTTELVP